MTQSTKKKRGLLMCATPLQVLIAEKIIEKSPDTDFYLIFTDHDYENKVKFRHYYNRLKSRCVKSLYWTDHYGLKNFVKFRMKLRRSELDIKYDKLYISNLERKHFSYMVSQNPDSDFFTFDDGVGNINTDSHFYTNDKPGFVKRLVWRKLGVKYFIPDLRHKSKLHYTIYKDLPNIINKTEFISLYDADEKALESIDNRKCKSIKIYLGQPLEPINAKFNKDYAADILKKLNIDYYFPHPRESEDSYKEFNIIDSQLIFEDYVVEYLKKHPNVELHIYSLISGALLNINKLHRVTVNYIYDPYLQANYPGFYSLVKNQFNIEIIKV